MNNFIGKYPPLVNPTILAQVAIQIANAMNKRALIHPQLAQRWREEASTDPEKVISEIAAELKHLKNRKGQNRGI